MSGGRLGPCLGKRKQEDMARKSDVFISIEHEELRGISRTVAEIEWLLLILTLLYQVVEGPAEFGHSAIAASLFFYAAFILPFHYLNFHRSEPRWKVTIE